MLPTDGGFVTEKLCLSLSRACTHYKFLNPCHRCRLAKLFDNQGIVGDNEVARVTRKGDFADRKASDHRGGCFPLQIGKSPIREGKL